MSHRPAGASIVLLGLVAVQSEDGHSLIIPAHLHGKITQNLIRSDENGPFFSPLHVNSTFNNLVVDRVE